MINFKKSMKLLFTHIKKYFILIIIAIMFLILATYLQLQAPKFMGEGFTALGDYIGIQIASNNIEEVDEKITSDDYLDEVEKKEIVTKLGLTGKNESEFMSKESEDIKFQNKMNKVLKEVIAIDENRINESLGLNQEQIKFINDSNLDENSKLTLINIPKESLKEISSNTVDFEKLKREKKDSFMKFIYSLIATYVTMVISMVLYSIAFVVISGGTTRKIRKGLFGKMERLSVKFYDMSNVGDLLSRFTNDIDNITMLLNETLVQILSNFFLVIGVGIMMWKEDTSSINVLNIVIQKPIFITVIIFGFFSMFLASFMLKKAEKYVSQQQIKLGNLNGFIDEQLSGQKEIITYNLKEKVVGEFNKFNEDLKEVSYKGQIYSGMLMPIMSGIGLIAMGIIILVGSELVIQGIFSVGMILAFQQYTQLFFSPLSSIFSQYNTVELGLTGANRVQEIFEEEETIVNSKEIVEFKNPNGIIQFKHVDFSYIEGKEILKDINIFVEPGKMVAIVGPTGSGKTTIMNLINRFYDINNGEILIDNINIKKYDISELRKNIGIVLQDSVLFHGTIEDNIKYGKDDASSEEIIKSAKIANIHDYIMTLPEKYQTKISNNSTIFSTGQKQLMSIARTIITNPAILVLDEATSNVDTITEAKIQIAMDNVISGRTSFVIAHRLKTILKADIILVLKDGEIIEQGSHKELIKENGFYAELYNNQFVE